MFVKLAATLALAATAMAQTFSIATPAAIVQCQPVSITWTGGVSPFILATIPGGQTGAAAISTLSSSLTASPYTWTVDLAAGTYLTLKLTGADGNIAYSSPLTVQAGSSNSCLNSSASTAGVATTGAITTTGSGSAVLSATSSAVGTTSTTSLARSSSAAVVSSASSAAAASSSSRASSASTPVSSAPASSTSAAAAASSSGSALGGAVAGIPAIAAGLLGGLAFLF